MINVTMMSETVEIMETESVLKCKLFESKVQSTTGVSGARISGSTSDKDLRIADGLFQFLIQTIWFPVSSITSYHSLFFFLIYYDLFYIFRLILFSFYKSHCMNSIRLLWAFILFIYLLSPDDLELQT